MKLHILAVGRGRGQSPEDVLAHEYLKRAQGIGAKLGFNKIELTVIETSKAANASTRKQEEAERMRGKLTKGSHIIVLDENGKTLSSEVFARKLTSLRDGGNDISFIIGGPDGLSPELLKNERMAFGCQTWPHLLVRAMLAEQIYRAFSILTGHPYHRA